MYLLKEEIEKEIVRLWLALEDERTNLENVKKSIEELTEDGNA